MANTLLLPPTRPLNLLCPSGHELPAVRVGLGESATVPCSYCGAVIRTSWYERDGEWHPTWSIIRHAWADRRPWEVG